MTIGYIKKCNFCKKEVYVRVNENCPQCGNGFNSFQPNKAPAGWVKMENYEISRKNVEQMVKEGTLSKEDLK